MYLESHSPHVAAQISPPVSGYAACPGKYCLHIIHLICANF
jgi:hypothetical protein